MSLPAAAIESRRVEAGTRPVEKAVAEHVRAIDDRRIAPVGKWR
ncbi:hypothetical protein [Neorhizobium galegae]|nr:hypothetical protein [Neorhizobium galegae]